ncbi:hypothetical protein ABOM_003658 [Aspergillus bombycis]|uniref:Protein kinase domain-containing protein n=1 Tax=Aspergillus bombycis TaxID=109264 RepID=A0A1F8A6R1_9EURO|nr:hypothetical protein ABOM_003658 [Aspergillus bombycis]OGM47025.1 hypothetical protein ABOM_003658 [Aspergillus bombycis]
MASIGEQSFYLPHSQLQEIQILEKLQSTETSEIFRVLFHNLEYCLKVFHIGDDPGLADDSRDLCRYRCESQVYQALHVRGACRLGIVPYFYGLFDSFDPEMLGPDLDNFDSDKFFPCVILLEYLPNAISFKSASLAPESVSMVVDGLKTIHSTGVIHNDAHPKNVLTVPETRSQRVVWIDFDISIVFSAKGTRGLLNLNDEAEWEVSIFESRARKMSWEWHALLSGVQLVMAALIVVYHFWK